MNKMSWTVVAAMLSTALAASAAADTRGTDGADAGAIYEWVDDGGRMHASDTVPDKYKSIARRIAPNRARLPAGEREEAERQAAALKAKAASAVPLSQAAGVATRPGAARTANLSGSLPGPDTSECAAWRRQIAANRECFVASTDRRGHGGGLHSCSNEADPPRPQTCGPDDSR